MAELVTIPISFFEAAMAYERPVFRLLTDRAKIIQAVFDALGPWNAGVDDTEIRNNGKLSEQGIAFKLPLKRVVFFFGAASCKFTRDDVDWGSADETVEMLEAALSALTSSGEVVLGTKSTAIALHIQPRTVHFMDILRPLLPGTLAALEPEAVQRMAAVAKWDNRRVTIDGSVSLANGLFLRLERGFEAGATYDEILRRLRQDQEELFKVLGVEEDQA